VIRVAFAALCLVAIAAPAYAGHASHCRDASHVFGYKHCTRFGAGWSRDVNTAPWREEIGWLHESFTPRPFTVPSTATSAVRTGGAVVGGRSAVTGNGSSMRYLTGGRILYGGLELSTLFYPSPTVDGETSAEGGAFQPLGVFGAHMSVWQLGLSAEVAGGPRIALLDYCEASPCTRATNQVSQVEGVLDARVGVSYFITPIWSIGAVYGQNMLDAGDRSIALYIGLHFRPFDGMY